MDLSNPNFISIAQLTVDEARELLEELRWNGNPICPHCKSEGAYKITPKTAESKTRPGLYKCKVCRKQFTVTVGTIFKDSRIALNKWLLAIFLMCSSKKGMSAHQLHRQLKVTYKTAWFMCHRIRYAMTQQPLSGMLNGKVEADEVYIGGKEKNKHASKRTPGTQGRSPKTKTPVAVLVERDGRVRAKKVDNTSAETLKANLREQVAPEARIMTDEWTSYHGLEKEFAGHETSITEAANTSEAKPIPTPPKAGLPSCGAGSMERSTTLAKNTWTATPMNSRSGGTFERAPMGNGL